MRRREFVASLLSIPAFGQAANRQVYVQNVTDRSATLRWNGSANGVRYFADGEPAREAMATGAGGLAEAKLTELSAGREYSYTIDEDSGGFRTAGDGPVAFLVIGDSGSGSAEQTALAERLVKERAQFLIHTGDVAYPTGQAETYATRYADYYHALMARIPFFPCPGNHDYYETRAEPYFTFHDLPSAGVPEREKGRYYAFDWGDATILSIDSNDPLEEPARRAVMLDWLDRTLGASTRFWRIVFFHHPPVASGPNEGDVLSALARRHLVPLLEKHCVPLVLNGHEHSYQRSIPLGSGETTYITSGGGGAGLYPVGASRVLAKGVSAHHYLRAEIDGYKMDVTAVGIAGETLDSVRMRPRPRVQSVVNAASFTRKIGRGSPVSVFGWHLGRAARLQANGLAMEVLAGAAGQVNAFLPPALQGPVRLTIATPNGTVETEIEILPFAPALFPEVQRGNGVVRAFATGLSGWTGSVVARIGGRTLPCRFTEGPMFGVQQVEFDWAGGMGELTLVAGEASSNAILIPGS